MWKTRYTLNCIFETDHPKIIHISPSCVTKAALVLRLFDFICYKTMVGEYKFEINVWPVSLCLGKFTYSQRGKMTFKTYQIMAYLLNDMGKKHNALLAKWNLIHLFHTSPSGIPTIMQILHCILFVNLKIKLEVNNKFIAKFQ